jgi:hypothetical protein
MSLTVKAGGIFYLLRLRRRPKAEQNVGVMNKIWTQLTFALAEYLKALIYRNARV